jgi:putative NADH-flavin reductase
MKTIALFGATGRTGIEIMKLALISNHAVNGFCRSRNSISFPDENLSIFEGSVLNIDDVRLAIENSDYVVSALGTKPPFTDIFCFDALKNIIYAMYDYNVRRLICITGAMIGDFTPNQSKFMKFMTNRFNKRKPLIALDRLKQETVVKASELAWTLIKPPRLTNGSLTEYSIGEALKITAFSSISRKSLAAAIINLIDDNTTFRKSFFVKK